MPFCPSVHLKQLRHRRRHENSQDARKTLNLRIREVCRCELRSSKSRQLAPYLSNSFMWKTLRTSVPRPSGQQCMHTNDEFAPMLEKFRVGCHRTWCLHCAWTTMETWRATAKRRKNAVVWQQNYLWRRHKNSVACQHKYWWRFQKHFLLGCSRLSMMCYSLEHIPDT